MDIFKCCKYKRYKIIEIYVSVKFYSFFLGGGGDVNYAYNKKKDSKNWDRFFFLVCRIYLECVSS